MNQIKETSAQIVITLLAAALVILAVMPLENTSWADSIRTEQVADGEGFPPAREADGPQPDGVVRYLASFLKIALFMGIPGLITLGVLRLTRRKPGKKAATRGVA